MSVRPSTTCNYPNHGTTLVAFPTMCPSLSLLLTAVNSPHEQSEVTVLTAGAVNRSKGSCLLGCDAVYVGRSSFPMKMDAAV